MKSGKKEIEKVFSYIVKIDDLSLMSHSQKLEKCGATKEQYNSAINCVGKRFQYHISKNHVKSTQGQELCNTYFKALYSNVNIKCVTGVYAMLTYLLSYLSKPEHTMTELMKMASKEAYIKDIREKMQSAGNIFFDQA